MRCLTVAPFESRHGFLFLSGFHASVHQPYGDSSEAIPQLANEAAPSQEMRDSQKLFNEPKYIRFDDGDVHTLESNGLKFKKGVVY